MPLLLFISLLLQTLIYGTCPLPMYFSVMVITNFVIPTTLVLPFKLRFVLSMVADLISMLVIPSIMANRPDIKYTMEL